MTERLLARLPLGLAGWQFEGQRLDVKKCVVLGVPHTSNWDGPLLLGLAQSVGVKISWMIKSDWVKGPIGVLMKRAGAIAIDRSGAHDVVRSMIEAFKAADELVLVIPPEGTRKRAEHWKSGFYHIALGAGVPVVPSYLDYSRKRGGLGAPIWLTGNMREDMDKIRAFYDEVRPKAFRPDDFGPIRLRDEA